MICLYPRQAIAGLALTAIFTLPVCGQQTHIVELRNGMRLGPGTIEQIETVSTSAALRATSGEVVSKPIDMLNDGLRKTYYNASPRNVLNVQPVASDRSNVITFPAAAEVTRSGGLQSFQGIESISPFNRNGRRRLIFRMANNKSMTVLQQITELTPLYAKLEILRGSDQQFAWDSREAISSIPSDQLQLVLENVLDLSRSSEWLRLYSFYIEAKRYREAKRVIEQAIQRFPAELGNRVNLIAQTDQLSANQQFEEINLRREAGQTKLAYSLLTAFPRDLIETQIKIKTELDQLSQNLEIVRMLTESLEQRVSRLPEADRRLVQPIIQELLDEISIESAVRLDDYLRLGTVDGIVNENAVSLAIGGWILGPGAGIQNFAVAKSLIRVRELTRQYLSEPNPQRRESLLSELRGEEGAQPELLAKLLSLMKPPWELPQHVPGTPEGCYRQLVQLPDGETAEYTLQLPPEYDPHRKYPCILALPGSIREYELSLPIDYWCGTTVQLDEMEARFGYATRHGYIVISPNWMRDFPTFYQYTEGEKSRILSCFRDAMRRTSVDTDRVFIAGHFEGATAAWDIAQSHPDLWAGAVFISPNADKFIPLYHSNIQAPNDASREPPLGTYIVYGEKDGLRFSNYTIGTVIDRYLKDNRHDSMLIEYIGQGRGLFSSELPRIFQWMQLSSHRRVRAPRTLNFVTMRPGDRFFYWLEAAAIAPENTTNAFELDSGSDAGRKGIFDANLLDPTHNTVRISKIPSADRSGILWLSPEMIDFSREVTVVFRGKTNKYNLRPEISIMLEDVRQRGDRNHFFWQRIQLGRN